MKDQVRQKRMYFSLQYEDWTGKQYRLNNPPKQMDNKDVISLSELVIISAHLIGFIDDQERMNAISIHQRQQFDSFDPRWQIDAFDHLSTDRVECYQ